MPKKLQYKSGFVSTNQECIKGLVQDYLGTWIPIHILNEDFRDTILEVREKVPGISNDFWNTLPEMFQTFVKKFPGLSDTFLEKFAKNLDTFLHEFPDKWDKFWEKSYEMLDNFKDKFSEMPDEFWKVFPRFMEKFMKNYDPDRMLCIVYPIGDTCPGDSGGPLITKPAHADGVTAGQNYEQIGINSFGPENDCNATGWTMFVRVTSFLGWIKDTVGTDHTNCGRY